MLDLGIHFGLPEQAHHDDPGLGSTDHKALLISPVQWQWRRLTALREALDLGDPDEKPDKAQAKAAGKLFGDAVHVITLLGDEAFEAKYAEAPVMPEGTLITREQVRDALGPRCSLPKGAALNDLIQLAKIHGVGPLEDDWKFARALALEGRTEISRRWAATIRLIGKLIDTPRGEMGGKSVRDLVLTNGAPEVTVIWIDPETGVRCKARFDYLRIKAIIDLKTFGLREGQELVDGFTQAVANFGYDVQTAHYREARDQVPGFIDRGAVFLHTGDAPPQAFIDGLQAYKGPITWTWLTVNTTGMPEIDVMELKAPIVEGSAYQQIRFARRKYVEHRDRYGADQLWVATRGIIDLEDAAFPPRITDRGSERWTPR